MIGKAVLHYRILEELGRGGMGVVYKARDTKLDRDVAIKLLPGHIANDPEQRERFKIEAKAAAALNHPNIATIHAIEEAQGQTFIVMEYIEGKELRKLIVDNSQLSIDDCLNYAIQIASGLQAAHAKGITHRDIKSSNIMVTDSGQIKIMDFGLAKIGNLQLTQVGTTLGTVSYMSPEQARGEPVDHRTDIWSFGVVLYEMLTGQLPFRGEYEQAVIYAILNENPEALSAVPGEVPDRLQQLVAKALAKDPQARYQSAGELLAGLQSIRQAESSTSAAANAEPPVSRGGKKPAWNLVWPVTAIAIILLAYLAHSIFMEEQSHQRIPVAVADFANYTGESELDALSGMLITALEQSRRLSVMPRSRMFDILQQLGKEGVTRIDEGLGQKICSFAGIKALVLPTIRKFGRVYAIDLKVLDTQQGGHLFTRQDKDEGQENIPDLIDRLAEQMRKELREEDAQIEKTNDKVAQVTTPNLEAYQHYFKGEEYLNKLDFDNAKAEFRKAIALDSTFGLAYYRLAYAMGWHAEALASEPLQKALQYIDRIPEKERFLVRAERLRQEQGFQAAVDLLKEMEKVYPNDKEMLFNIGDYSFHSGDFKTAVTYFEEVLDLDPGHQRTRFHFAEALIRLYTDPAYVNGDFESALRRAQAKKAERPDLIEMNAVIATLYAYMEEYEKAEAVIREFLEQATNEVARQQGNLWLHSLLPYTGQYSRAIDLLTEGIDFSFTAGDTASEVIGRIFKVLLLVEGYHDQAQAKQVVDKAWKHRDRKDVPFLQDVMAVACAASGQNARAFELLEQLGPTGIVSQGLVLSMIGECGKSAPIVAQLQQIPGLPDFLIMWNLYHLARCQFEQGELEQAEKNAAAALEIYWPLNMPIRGIYYPKLYFLLGQIRESKGDTAAAIESYERFLQLWNQADQNLRDLIEARSRLAKLKGA